MPASPFVRPVSGSQYRGSLLASALLALWLSGCGRGAETPQPTPAAPPPAPAAATTAAVPDGPLPTPALPPATVLARVGNGQITAGDVATALAAMTENERRTYVAPAALRELVERLADRPRMAAAARAAGLDQDPVMKEMLATPLEGYTAEQMLAEVWLETELAKTPAVTADDIERYYSANQAATPGVDGPAGNAPALDAVRTEIRATLEAQRREATLASLRGKLRTGTAVAIDDTALAAFYGPTTATAPAPGPATPATSQTP